MSLFKRLFNAVKSGSVTNEQWDEIRNNLISGDLGAKLVDQLIAEAKLAKPEDIRQSIINVIQQSLSRKDRTLTKNLDRVCTILVVGVNGTGKTTSTAKLANLITKEKKSVLLAAADTFRAAAVDQLQTWASRIGIEVISGAANSDPASVAYAAIAQAKSKNFDYLIVDTAGRLHTKENLMQELGKIIRVINKHSPVDEILLVIDATTGQNGMNQAKVFIEVAGVTGFILTKLDGSAKGGIGLAIERESGLPIKFIGTGEKISDLAPFDPVQHISSMFD
jgi:fused signal recognition particle receptor